MRYETKVISFIIFLTIVAATIWMFDIPIVSNFRILMTIIVVVIVLIFTMPKLLSRSNLVSKKKVADSFEAFNYVQKKWQENRHELLRRKDSCAFSGFIAGTSVPVYGFRVEKENGQNVYIVLNGDTMDIIYDEYPASHEVVDDPLKLIEREGVIIAPTPNMSPDSLRKWKTAYQPPRQQISIYPKEKKSDIEKMRGEADEEEQ